MCGCHDDLEMIRQQNSHVEFEHVLDTTPFSPDTSPSKPNLSSMQSTDYEMKGEEISNRYEPLHS
jgi:hypothetical protein